MRKYKTIGNIKLDVSTYILIFIAFFSNVASVVFSSLNATNTGGLFYNTIGNLSNKYYTEVTPAGFTFGIIWPIIYLTSLAGSLYVLVTAFLPPNESPAKTVPTLVPRQYLICYSIGFLSTVGWLFAFDREMLELSFALLVVGMLSFYYVIATSLVLVYDNLAKLEINSKVMLWMVRILIQNGLCIAATWVTLATFIGFTMVLVYEDSFGKATATLRGRFTVDDGSTITLLVLFLFIVAFFVIENIKYEKYFRYVFSVFPVFIFAFIGLVVKLAPTHQTRNFIWAYILLAACSVLFLVRIFLSVYRFIYQPIGAMYDRHTDKNRLLTNSA